MFGYEGLSKVTRAGSLRGILRILKIMSLIDIHLSAHMDLHPMDVSFLVPKFLHDHYR